MTKFLVPLAVLAGLLSLARGSVVWEPAGAVVSAYEGKVDDLCVNGQRAAAIAADTYLWLSNDGGMSWSQVFHLRSDNNLNLPPNKHLKAVAVGGAYTYVGGNGFVATTRDGEAWNYFDGKFSNVKEWYIVDIAALDSGSYDVFAAGYFLRDGDRSKTYRPFVIRSTDNGETWHRWGVPPCPKTSTAIRSICATRREVIVVGGTNALLASRVNAKGSAWDSFNAPDNWSGRQGPSRAITCVTAVGGMFDFILWAGRNDGRLITWQRGRPWRTVKINDGFVVKDIAFRTTKEGAVIGYYRTPEEFTFYTTTDGGKHWRIEPIASTVLTTSFHLEASASRTAHFLADCTCHRECYEKPVAWLMQRHEYVDIAIPPRLKLRRPIALPEKLGSW